MRISAKGEYAAKAVLYLSLNYPHVVTIHEVAASHRIPLKYLEQILLELRKAGLLASRRGVHGGYTLARPPAEISVGEVLRAVDGKFSRANCLEEDSGTQPKCLDPASCGLQQVWANLQATVERVLFRTSFAEVCRRGSEAQGKGGELVAELKTNG